MTLLLVPPEQKKQTDGEWFGNAPPALAPLFSPYFDGLSVELCIAAGFDDRGCLRSFFGATGSADCNLALIPSVRAALRHCGVVGIVIAHNHPDGDSHASASDIETTRRVAALCRLAGAHLVDHLLFAGKTIVSFRAQNLI